MFIGGIPDYFDGYRHVFSFIENQIKKTGRGGETLGVFFGGRRIVRIKIS
jgi:hypothetical protein